MPIATPIYTGILTNREIAFRYDAVSSDRILWVNPGTFAAVRQGCPSFRPAHCASDLLAFTGSVVAVT